MSQRMFTAGIDVGTHMTRVVVLEYGGDTNKPRLLGTGESESRGMRHGYVVNSYEAATSIKTAVAQAQKAAGISIKEAAVSIGGISLGSLVTSGDVVISKANGEVTDFDIEKALDASREKAERQNKRIIDVIPLTYYLDGQEVLGRPEGMVGKKLRVQTLSISCLDQHLQNLIDAVERAGVSIASIVAAPVAAGYATLTRRQRVAGSLLVNIGAETVTAAVFENDNPYALHVFAIGSTDITNDIALGLQVPLDEAENIKVGNVMSDVPKKKIGEIIEARLHDIFELLQKYLKHIKRDQLLPAGVVITGGGARIADIVEHAKKELRLPARIGTLVQTQESRSKVHDPVWFVAFGLSLAEQLEVPHRRRSGSLLQYIQDAMRSIGRQLLP